MERNIVLTGYDAVYAATPNSPTFRRLWHEHAEGDDYPEQFGHVSFVTLPELRHIAAELHLDPATRWSISVAAGVVRRSGWHARRGHALSE